MNTTKQIRAMPHNLSKKHGCAVLLCTSFLTFSVFSYSVLLKAGLHLLSSLLYKFYYLRFAKQFPACALMFSAWPLILVHCRSVRNELSIVACLLMLQSALCSTVPLVLSCDNCSTACQRLVFCTLAKFCNTLAMSLAIMSVHLLTL
jgi:hypothetical protein